MFHMTAIYGGIMIGLSLLSSVSKHNMWSYYDWIYCCFCSSVNIIYMVVSWLGCSCRPSGNTIYGRIMIGLSLSSVSKHNIWSCYDWVYCCCRSSVSTIYGHIMIGLSLSSVSKHNIWSYYDWVVVCRPSVNIICDCIMIGLLSCFRDVSSTLRFGHSTFRPQTISAIVYI